MATLWGNISRQIIYRALKNIGFTRKKKKDLWSFAYSINQHSKTYCSEKVTSEVLNVNILLLTKSKA